LAQKQRRTRRCSEREPADSLKDEFNVIGGWLPSLTFALYEMSAVLCSRRWLLASGVLVIVLGAFVAIGPASPSGHYTADPRIGIEGDFYWELSKGKVELVHEGGRTYYGRYVKTNATWLWIDDRRSSHDILRIQPSWWRLRLSDQKSGERDTWGYRRLW